VRVALAVAVLTLLTGAVAVAVPLGGLVGTVGVVAAAGGDATGDRSGSVGVDDRLGVAALTLDIPVDALVAYRLAAGSCPGLSWSLLAAIGRVESDHGRAPSPGVRAGANAAGAEGPMQLVRATFAEYAVDAGDGDVASPYDQVDAALAAARLLCANGAATAAGRRPALFSYNHSWSYVDDVLGWAAHYEQGLASVTAGARPGLAPGTAPAPISGTGPVGSVLPGDPWSHGSGTGASTGARGRLAAAWALRRLGSPYAWGATGPGAFDCSGLVLRAWQAAGVSLPRVAADQFGAGAHVALDAAVTGDLLFFAADPRDAATIHHVAIYLGNGLMVEAPHPGASVQVVSVYPDGLVPLATRPGL